MLWSGKVTESEFPQVGVKALANEEAGNSNNSGSRRDWFYYWLVLEDTSPSDSLMSVTCYHSSHFPICVQGVGRFECPLKCERTAWTAPCLLSDIRVLLPPTGSHWKCPRLFSRNRELVNLRLLSFLRGHQCCLVSLHNKEYIFFFEYFTSFCCFFCP